MNTSSSTANQSDNLADEEERLVEALRLVRQRQRQKQEQRRRRSGGGGTNAENGENLRLQITEAQHRRNNRTAISTYRQDGELRAQVPINKKWLLVKPTQSGKTREVLLRVVDAFRNNGHISVVFCDNSLLQVSQTKQRALHHVNGVYEMSSSKNANMDNPDALVLPILQNKVRIIMVCANSIQYANISKLINDCNQVAPNKKFEIFIDEADKVATSDNAEQFIKEWERLNNVKVITFITATPQDSPSNGLFSTFGEFNLCYLQNGEFDSVTYVALADCEHQYLNPASSGEDTVAYALRILNAAPLKHGVPGEQMGDYAFIPASFLRAAHLEMREMLLTRGAVVVVLNGLEKNMTYTHKDATGRMITSCPIQLANIESKPVATVLNSTAKLLAIEFGRPLVITGNICVSRGVTLQTEELIFTRAIFGPGVAPSPFHRMIKAKVYQLMGRILGNIKHFPRWKPCLVHCPEKAFEIANSLEQMAILIAKRSNEHGEDGPHTIMDHEDYLDMKCKIEGNQWTGFIWESSPHSDNNGIIPESIWNEACTKYAELGGKLVPGGDGNHYTPSHSNQHVGHRTKSSTEATRWHITNGGYWESGGLTDKGKKTLRELHRTPRRSMAPDTNPFRINPYYNEDGQVVWVMRHFGVE